jgi:hypothetical protein
MKILGFALSDYGWLLQIANILALAIGGWAALWMRQKFVAQAEFMAAIQRIIALETSHTIDAERIPTKSEVAALRDRLQLVEAGDKLFEERMKSLATREDIDDVKKVLADQDGMRRDVSGEVASVKATVTEMNKTLGMLSKYLLTGGGKS